VRWGVYASAIHRWEHVLGRPAPAPTQPGRHGRPVLAPPFVEHPHGPAHRLGHGSPAARTAQLRALGNSVMPQQAAHALLLLLGDLHALRARSTDPEHNAAA
jgi:DNA (cytosine-5)-methyltransferase 1